MRAQYLDSMDLERERGITIKAQNVRLDWQRPRAPPHRHAGSRRLRLRGVAVAGRVRGRRARRRRRAGHRGPDARQLLPRPRERPRDRRRAQQDRSPGGRPRPLRGGDRDASSASRPTRSCGSVPRRARAFPSCSTRWSTASPPPTGDRDAPLQALIFDSYFDQYRGVVSSVRVMNGRLSTGARLRFLQTNAVHDADEIGFRAPTPDAGGRCSSPARSATSSPASRTWARPRSGETVTEAAPAGRGARGLSRPEADGVLRAVPSRWRRLREPPRGAREAASERCQRHLRARDVWRVGLRVPMRLPRVSSTWRSCGSGSSASSTSASSRPRLSVEYRVHTIEGEIVEVDNPSAMPASIDTASIEEPMLRVTVLTPSTYTGTVMDLCQTASRRDASSSSTCHRSGSSSSTASLWPRSSSTSSIS